jgi:uncharacterized protein YndB with AHSA1/START domain
MDDARVRPTGITLRLRRSFEAPPKAVYRAWTRPEALRLWWCPVGWLPDEIEMDLRVGGAFRIGMCRESGAQRVSVSGCFLEVRPAARLVYTWQWDGVFDEMPETRVTIEFRATADGTEVALTHENINRMPLCTQHLSAWLAACDRLATIMRRGAPPLPARRYSAATLVPIGQLTPVPPSPQ